jgi:hypothetical protein
MPVVISLPYWLERNVGGTVPITNPDEIRAFIRVASLIYRLDHPAPKEGLWEYESA